MRTDKASTPYRDPYASTAPDCAERHRTVSYEIMPGLVRTDIGAPCNTHTEDEGEDE